MPLIKGPTKRGGSVAQPANANASAISAPCASDINLAISAKNKSRKPGSQEKSVAVARRSVSSFLLLNSYFSLVSATRLPTLRLPRNARRLDNARCNKFSKMNESGKQEVRKL